MEQLLLAILVVAMTLTVVAMKVALTRLQNKYTRIKEELENQELGKVNLNTPNEAYRNDGQPGTKTEPPSFDDAPEWAKFLTVNNLGTWVWHETQPTRISMKGDINMWASKGKAEIARLDFRTPKLYEK